MSMLSLEEHLLTLHRTKGGVALVDKFMLSLNPAWISASQNLPGIPEPGLYTEAVGSGGRNPRWRLKGAVGRMKMTRIFALTVLSVAVLLLAACGGGGQQSGAPPEGNGGQDASGTGTKRASSSGEGSGDFSVTTLEGKEFDLSGGRGEVVALYFMAGW